MRIFIAAIALLALLYGAHTLRGREDSAAQQGGTLFQYTDESGSVHFVKSREEVPEAYRDAAGVVEISIVAGRAGKGHTAAAPAEVVLYTTSWCGWCRKTIAWLDRNGVRYTNKDIESNPRWRDELIRKSGGTAVPFVQIGDVSVRGFSAERMSAALGRG